MKTLRNATTIILSTTILCIGLGVGVAQARHFSVAQAVQTVKHWAGPGTAAKCRQASQHSGICWFATPAENFGIYWEGTNEQTGQMERESAGTFEDYVRVIDGPYRVATK